MTHRPRMHPEEGGMNQYLIRKKLDSLNHYIVSEYEREICPLCEQELGGPNNIEILYCKKCKKELVLFHRREGTTSILSPEIFSVCVPE